MQIDQFGSHSKYYPVCTLATSKLWCQFLRPILRKSIKN